jgi:hypothetical protein
VTAVPVAATAPNSFGPAVPESSAPFSTVGAHLCGVVDAAVTAFLVAATAPYSIVPAVPEASDNFFAGNANNAAIPCFTCDVDDRHVSVESVDHSIRMERWVTTRIRSIESAREWLSR